MNSKSARQEAVNSLKQNLILDAAFKVVARDGYFAAKLEDIAEEAGFSKAALYHYFPDKEALFLNLIIREQQASFESCVEIMERNLPFLDTLREIIYTISNRITANAKITGFAGESTIHLMLSALASMLTKHESLLKEAHSIKHKFRNLLSGLVERAKQSGVLYASLDSKTICSFIGAIIQTICDDACHSCQNGVKDYDLYKTINGILVLLNPWVNDKPETVSAEGGVNRA
ncbi:MAG: TetR/AcrR family transcriptional regulator [Chitinispirillales bacterium]|jgi:AcrR family transcriptional regulator|nr:TetR/AcrR family transcriptional regulator [Chitinispirillales bacterium]